MKNLNVGQRLLILSPLACSALAGIAAIGISGISTMLGSVEELYSHNLRRTTHWPHPVADGRQPRPDHAGAATRSGGQVFEVARPSGWQASRPAWSRTATKSAPSSPRCRSIRWTRTRRSPSMPMRQPAAATSRKASIRRAKPSWPSDFDGANRILLSKINPLYTEATRAADAYTQFIADEGKSNFETGLRDYALERNLIVGIGLSGAPAHGRLRLSGGARHHAAAAPLGRGGERDRRGQARQRHRRRWPQRDGIAAGRAQVDAGSPARQHRNRPRQRPPKPCASRSRWTMSRPG
jgi:hypothetical protein